MLGFHPTYNGVTVQLGLNWIASKHWKKTVEKLVNPGYGHEAMYIYVDIYTYSALHHGTG